MHTQCAQVFYSPPPGMHTPNAAGLTVCPVWVTSDWLQSTVPILPKRELQALTGLVLDFLCMRGMHHPQEECRALIAACMARGNAQLALSTYGTMCRVRPGSSAFADRHMEQAAWPPATLETVSAVVTAQCSADVSLPRTLNRSCMEPYDIAQGEIMLCWSADSITSLYCR